MSELTQISTHEDAPVPEEGTAEHEQAMVQLAEESNSVDREDGGPAWLPDKFKSPEDMAKAYHELEQKLSAGNESVTSNDEGTQPPQTLIHKSPHAPEQEIQEARKTLEQSGLDYNKFANEYTETGELTEASYKELSDKGMSTEMVNSWIQGQEAIQGKIQDAAFNSVGGEKNYNTLVDWAGKNLPNAEIEAFNRALETPRVEDTMFAIKSLFAQYKLTNGNTPKLIQGTTGTSSSGSFTSLAQMSEAMKDPKYQTDSAFREEVANKMATSNLM